MTKQVFHLVSSQVRQNACDAINSAPTGYKVTIAPKGRSLLQNAFSHSWYMEIAQAFPEDDAVGWKAYCKLTHGVPILVAEDEEFAEAYNYGIRNMDYATQLVIMRLFPVTSLMNVRQLTAYAEAVQEDFARRGLVLQVQGK